MRRKIFTRRRGVGIATVALGLSGLSLAVAGPAGATPPNATEMTGSGSNTAYALMVQEGNLFNSAPGCDMAGSGAVPLDLNCGTDPVSPGTDTPGENGYNQVLENPYNDYTVQAPAVGSGNGVNQLNSTAGFQPAYARASSGPSGSNGTSKQNYIAYAVDGVDWSAFSKEGSTALPASYVSTTKNGLSQTQITDIWAGSLPGCTLGTGKHAVTLGAMEWGCLFPPIAKPKAAEVAAAKKPIDCYVAQAGSGTAGTWATYAGYNKSNSPTIGCLLDEAGDTVDPLGGSAAENDHYNLFENEMSQIANNENASHTAVNDQADAIYFFSYGKFSTLCPGGLAAGVCPDTKVGGSQYYTTLGNIDYTSGTSTIVLSPNKADIQGLGGGQYTATDKWQVLRNLFNVYNNSSDTVTSPANQATLNLASEYGFLCKTTTVTDIDPLTGVAYRTEIENDITDQGFFPIDTSPSSPFSEGTLSDPAVITDANYQTVDPSYNQSNPTGFCLSQNG